MRSSTIHRFAALGSAFGWLLMSDAVTLLALMVGQVALPWWIASEGGAHDLALYSAVTSAFAVIAIPLLSPLGDRLPKRQLIFGAPIIFSLASAGVATLATAGHYHLGALIALGAVPVLAMAALIPAVSSFAAELVPSASLSKALSLQQTAQATGRMIGPAIGGAVLGIAGTAVTLWLNAVMLVIAAAAARHLPRGVAPRERQASWWRDLGAGVRANWRIPMERGWIVVNFLSWIFLFPTFTMLVPLKVKSLGLSGTWLGLCEAGLALGMLLGSLGGSRWMIERVGRFWTRVGAAALQGGALAMVGMASHGMLLVIGFTVAGLMNSAMVLVGVTHRMLARPQAYRARMVAGSVATTHVAAMIGPTLAGFALLHVPVVTVFTSFALLGATAALGLACVPGFRSFMSLDHEAVENFYGKNFPRAFIDSAPAESPATRAGRTEHRP